MIHTFDIFDTLVVRPWARPQRVFEELAETLAEQAGVAPAGREEWRTRFREARVAAERRAYRETPGDHATLAEIYERFDLPRQHGLDPTVVMRREIELEISLLQPVPSRTARVLELRVRGEKVLFLTDMYLPPEALVRVLGKCGIAATPDDLRISGHLKKAKWRGRMFRHVRAEFRHLRERFHHTGDNLRSDVWMPRLHGWKATFAADAHPNRYEQAWAAAGEPLADTGEVCRYLRLTAPAAPLTPAFTRAVASVAAPVLAMMAAHTLDVARRQRLDRLYFIARDACVIRKLAEQLRREGDPELRYLHGSRQAWFLATRNPEDFDGFRWLTPQGISSKLRDILARVEMGDEVRPVLEPAGLWIENRELTAPEIDRLKQLLAAPPLADALRQRIATRRGEMADYLRQEGFVGPGRAGTVDIGWFLNTHDALCRLLRSEGATPDFDAVYLGLVRRNPPGLQTARLHPLVVEREPGPLVREARALLQNSLVFEMVFTPAPHGSTTGYRRGPGGLTPELNTAPGCLPVESVNALHELAEAWLRDFLGRGLPPDLLLSADFRRVALGNLARFFMDPGSEDILALDGLSISSDPNEARRKPVVNRITTASLAAFAWKNVLLRGRRGFFERDYFWLAASARRSSPPVRAGYELVRALGLYGSHLR